MYVIYLEILVSSVAKSEIKDVFSCTTQLGENTWMTTCTDKLLTNSFKYIDISNSQEAILRITVKILKFICKYLLHCIYNTIKLEIVQMITNKESNIKSGLYMLPNVKQSLKVRILKNTWWQKRTFLV